MTNKQKIEKALSKVKKTLLPNGKWHVKGTIDLYKKKLTTLKYLNVDIVDGNFNCSFNTLTSLKGAPREVVGEFLCHSNKLTTLKGAPLRQCIH